MGELNKNVALGKLKDYEIRKERHDKAQILVDERKFFQAVKLFRENLDWSLANFGPDHATTVYDQETLSAAISELANLNETKNRGKNDEAAKQRIKALYEEARDLDEKALETRFRIEGISKSSLETQRSLARDYMALGENNKAAELLRKNYDARRNHPDFGEDDEETLQVGYDLAGCWNKLWKYEKAKALSQKILDARIRLNKPETDIGKSRNALQLNNKRIEERRKKREQVEKKAADEERPEALLGAKGNGEGPGKNNKDAGRKSGLGGGKPVGWKPPQWNGSDQNKNQGGRGVGGKQAGKIDSTTPVPLPEIIYKYVDPRASGIHPGSDASSIKSGSDGSNSPTLSFRTGAGPRNRPPTPHIVEAEPEQRQDRFRPRPWAQRYQESQATPQTQNLAPSDNLKPTDNNSGMQAERERPRSLSAGKDNNKDSKPRPRARSASPPKDHKHFRQLSDAGPGKTDKVSTRDVNNWFFSLEEETQALLLPLRRARCKRVKIAVLDTGIDMGHPSFAADQTGDFSSRRIKSREDFLDPGGNAHDVCGHGTHCVGLLCRVAPEADIYVARVAKDFDGDLSADAVAKAILRACRSGKDEEAKKNWGVDIISMSFGFYGYSKAVQTAIQEALAKPVLMFAAASNNGTMRKVTFPAWLSGVICVNSATATGTASLFNPEPKAPQNFSIIGENIKSAWTRHPDNYKSNSDQERVMSGTSVATPIMAGVAALVLEFVLQNDPESVLIEQLEDLKHQDGMPEVLAKMLGGQGRFRNVVPWELLSVKNGRPMVTFFLMHALRNFRGE